MDRNWVRLALRGNISQGYLHIKLTHCQPRTDLFSVWYVNFFYAIYIYNEAKMDSTVFKLKACLLLFYHLKRTVLF